MYNIFRIKDEAWTPESREPTRRRLQDLLYGDYRRGRSEAGPLDKPLDALPALISGARNWARRTLVDTSPDDIERLFTRHLPSILYSSPPLISYSDELIETDPRISPYPRFYPRFEGQLSVFERIMTGEITRQQLSDCGVYSVIMVPQGHQNNRMENCAIFWIEGSLYSVYDSFGTDLPSGEDGTIRYIGNYENMPSAGVAPDYLHGISLWRAALWGGARKILWGRQSSRRRILSALSAQSALLRDDPVRGEQPPHLPQVFDGPLWVEDYAPYGCGPEKMRSPDFNFLLPPPTRLLTEIRGAADMEPGQIVSRIYHLIEHCPARAAAFFVKWEGPSPSSLDAVKRRVDSELENTRVLLAATQLLQEEVFHRSRQRLWEQDGAGHRVQDGVPFDPVDVAGKPLLKALKTYFTDWIAAAEAISTADWTEMRKHSQLRKVVGNLDPEYTGEKHP